MNNKRGEMKRITGDCHLTGGGDAQDKKKWTKQVPFSRSDNSRWEYSRKGERRSSTRGDRSGKLLGENV